MGKSMKIPKSYGGTFYVSPLFPIVYKTRNPELKKAIERYNKVVKYFYLNFIAVVIAIVLFNLSEN